MSRKKVLLVDDVEPFLQLEKRYFNPDEFELCFARDGHDGLSKVNSQHPHLVFLDLFMPRMDGVECCRAIKHDPKFRETPVVMVTASGYDSDYECCREAGCDEILLKPLTRRVVQRTARRFLRLNDRADLRARARLVVRYGSDPRALLSDYTVDLSTGGLFLETEHPLSIGTPISTEFVLPDGGPCIRCTARIAWINPRERKVNPALGVGMGVQFVDLNLQGLDAIRRFVRSREVVAVW